jgi:hypothetical protein
MLGSPLCLGYLAPLGRVTPTLGLPLCLGYLAPLGQVTIALSGLHVGHVIYQFRVLHGWSHDLPVCLEMWYVLFGNA